jgi:hypothetical protein
MCGKRLNIFNKNTEFEFLDLIGTKVLGVFLLAIHSHFFQRIVLPPPPLSERVLKLVCNVSIVYGNLKSENSQDNVQNLDEIIRS